jgi:anti-sigma regulatory factor (Ser/Thr protein kinase)
MSSQINVSADLLELAQMMAFIRSCGSNLNPTDLRKLELALEESLVNIIQHAYPDTPGGIEIHFTPYYDYLIFTLRDQGFPFNPLLAQPKVASGSLEERTEGGLGLLLIREFMDEMYYTRQDPYNILTLVKKI